MPEVQIAVRRAVKLGLYFLALTLAGVTYIALRQGVGYLSSPSSRSFLSIALGITVAVPLLAGILTFVEHRRKRPST
jgi:hypothetical protein